ncbi:hypothetical protein AAMO2058_000299700, partial [Amorphochlora amoebiformis]
MGSTRDTLEKLDEMVEEKGIELLVVQLEIGILEKNLLNEVLRDIRAKNSNLIDGELLRIKKFAENRLECHSKTNQNLTRALLDEQKKSRRMLESFHRRDLEFKTV